MSQHVDRFKRSFEAGADLSAYQYRFVKFSGAQIVLATGPTDDIIGVLQDKPDTVGQAASVAMLGAGSSKLVTSIADGAIARGNAVTCDAQGRGVLCDAATDLAYVQALEPCAATGTVIEARLDYPGLYHNS